MALKAFCISLSKSIFALVLINFSLSKVRSSEVTALQSSINMAKKFPVTVFINNQGKNRINVINGCGQENFVEQKNTSISSISSEATFGPLSIWVGLTDRQLINGYKSYYMANFVRSWVTNGPTNCNCRPQRRLFQTDKS